MHHGLRGDGCPCLSIRQIQTLCEIGPCQPCLNEPYQFPTDELGRKFQISWYVQSFGKGNMKEERNWLVYSPTHDKMYCQACWLFADCKSENYSMEWSDPDSGVFNWKKGREKIAKHEASNQHKNAIHQYLLAKYRISKDNIVLKSLLIVSDMSTNFILPYGTTELVNFAAPGRPCETFLAPPTQQNLNPPLVIHFILQQVNVPAFK